MPPLKMRTVVRDELFEADFRDIESRVKTADEFIEGIEMVLSREPECGHRIKDSHVWFKTAHTLPLVIYYTFDENNVFLLSIQRSLLLEL